LLDWLIIGLGLEFGDDVLMLEWIGGEDFGYELVEDRVVIDVGMDVFDDIECEVLCLCFVEDFI